MQPLARFLGNTLAAIVASLPLSAVAQRPVSLEDAVLQASRDFESEDPFEVPPAADALEPVLSGSIYLGVGVPLEAKTLCPNGSECVFSGAGNVGAQIERRWPSGPAVGLSYELGFVNSNAVYELGLLQELRGQARYYFLPRSLLHPFIGGGVGAVVFGDTFRIATAGVSATAFVGVELEMTELLSVFVTLPVRAVRFGAFTTDRDGVRRASDGNFTVTASLQVGIAITQIR